MIGALNWPDLTFCLDADLRGGRYRTLWDAFEPSDLTMGRAKAEGEVEISTDCLIVPL